MERNCIIGGSHPVWAAGDFRIWQILLQKSPAAAALNVSVALCWPLARLEAAAVTHLN